MRWVMRAVWAKALPHGRRSAGLSVLPVRHQTPRSTSGPGAAPSWQAAVQPVVLLSALRYWSPTMPAVSRRGSMRMNALVRRLAAPGTYRYFRSRRAVMPSRAARFVGISHLRSGVKLLPAVISLTTPPGVKVVIETLRPSYSWNKPQPKWTRKALVAEYAV